MAICQYTHPRGHIAHLPILVALPMPASDQDNLHTTYTSRRTFSRPAYGYTRAHTSLAAGSCLPPLLLPERCTWPPSRPSSCSTLDFGQLLFLNLFRFRCLLRRARAVYFNLFLIPFVSLSFCVGTSSPQISPWSHLDLVSSFSGLSPLKGCHTKPYSNSSYSYIRTRISAAHPSSVPLFSLSSHTKGNFLF